MSDEKEDEMPLWMTDRRPLSMPPKRNSTTTSPFDGFVQAAFGALLAVLLAWRLLLFNDERGGIAIDAVADEKKKIKSDESDGGGGDETEPTTIDYHNVDDSNVVADEQHNSSSLQSLRKLLPTDTFDVPMESTIFGEIDPDFASSDDNEPLPLFLDTITEEESDDLRSQSSTSSSYRLSSASTVRPAAVDYILNHNHQFFDSSSSASSSSSNNSVSFVDATCSTDTASPHNRETNEDLLPHVSTTIAEQQDNGALPLPLCIDADDIDQHQGQLLLANQVHHLSSAEIDSTLHVNAAVDKPAVVNSTVEKEDEVIAVNGIDETEQQQQSIDLIVTNTDSRIQSTKRDHQQSNMDTVDVVGAMRRFNRYGQVYVDAPLSGVEQFVHATPAIATVPPPPPIIVYNRSSPIRIAQLPTSSLLPPPPPPPTSRKLPPPPAPPPASSNTTISFTAAVPSSRSTSLSSDNRARFNDHTQRSTANTTTRSSAADASAADIDPTATLHSIDKMDLMPDRGDYTTTTNETDKRDILYSSQTSTKTFEVPKRQTAFEDVKYGHRPIAYSPVSRDFTDDTRSKSAASREIPIRRDAPAIGFDQQWHQPSSQPDTSFSRQEYIREEQITRTIISRSTETLSCSVVPAPNQVEHVFIRNEDDRRSLKFPNPKSSYLGSSEHLQHLLDTSYRDRQAAIEAEQRRQSEVERLRRERIEIERRERERAEMERVERERIEMEKIKRERTQLEIIEREIIERERIDKERREIERRELERRQAELRKLEQREIERRAAEELRRKEAERKAAEEARRIEAERRELERLEKQRLEAERIEKERREKERIELERRAAEHREKERIEAERREKERIEAERREQQRREAERLELLRLEAERIEKERLEAERREKERREKERIELERREKERLEAERREKERREKERIELERRAAERRERERIEAERREKERLEAERREKERREKERIEQERREAEKLELLRREAERLEAERREAERRELERREKERIELERLEAERRELKRREDELRELEKREAERREAERLEAIRLENERRERERLEMERLEAERIEAKRRELERLELERREAEKREAERRELERLEAERRAAERREFEKKEAARHEAERKEFERRIAEQLEAERREFERREAERLAADRLEFEKREAAKLEADKREFERREAARLAAEKLEFERREAIRIANEKREFDKRELERRDAERREFDRRDAEQRRIVEQRLENERREAEKAAAARREIERRESERIAAEQKEAQRRAAERRDADRREKERKEAELNRARAEVEQREKERKEAELNRARADVEQRERQRIDAERQRIEIERREVERLRIERERIERERIERERKETTHPKKALGGLLTSRETLEQLTKDPYWTTTRQQQPLPVKESTTTTTTSSTYMRVEQQTWTAGGGPTRDDDVRHPPHHYIMPLQPPFVTSSAPSPPQYAPPPLSPPKERIYQQRKLPEEDETSAAFQRGSSKRTSRYRSKIEKARRDFLTQQSPDSTATLGYTGIAKSEEEITERFRKSMDDMRRPTPELRGPLLQKFHSGEFNSKVDLTSLPPMKYAKVAPSPYDQEYNRLVEKAEQNWASYRRRMSQPNLYSRSRAWSTSYLETDVDTGKGGQISTARQVEETNLDDVHHQQNISYQDRPISAFDYDDRQSRNRVKELAAASVETSHLRSKSVDYLMDRRAREDVEPPENQLQKVLGDPSVHNLSEHELRFRKSVDKLEVPGWYLQSDMGTGGKPRDLDASYSTNASYRPTLVSPDAYSREYQPTSQNARPYSSQSHNYPPHIEPSKPIINTNRQTSHITEQTRYVSPWTYGGRYSGQHSRPQSATPLGRSKSPAPIGDDLPVGMFDKYKHEIEELRRSRNSLHPVERVRTEEMSRTEQMTRTVRMEPDRSTDGLVGSYQPATTFQPINTANQSHFRRQDFGSHEGIVTSTPRASVKSRPEIETITRIAPARSPLETRQLPGYTVSSVPVDWNAPKSRNSRVIEVTDTFVGPKRFVDSSGKVSQRYGGRATIEEVLDAIFMETPSSRPYLDDSGSQFDSSLPHIERPVTPLPFEGPSIYTKNYMLMDHVIKQPENAEELLKRETLYVRCGHCHKTKEISEARHRYVSCKHCYVYYCSRQCRYWDWDKHVDRCSFARINTLCKDVIMKVREDGEAQTQMSRVARQGYTERGRGSVNFRFGSTQLASRYVKLGWNHALYADPSSYLFYYTIPTLIEERKEPSLIALCRKYDPRGKFILSVSIIADIEECPQTPPPEPSNQWGAMTPTGGSYLPSDPKPADLNGNNSFERFADRYRPAQQQQQQQTVHMEHYSRLVPSDV